MRCGNDRVRHNVHRRLFPARPNNHRLPQHLPNVNTSDNGVAKIDYHINDKNTLNGLLSSANTWEWRRSRLHQSSSSTVIQSRPGQLPALGLHSQLHHGERSTVWLQPHEHQTDNRRRSVKDPVNTGATVPGFPILASIPRRPFGLSGTWHNRPQSSAPNPYWDVQESLSYLVGKHALKFGGEYTTSRPILTSRIMAGAGLISPASKTFSPGVRVAGSSSSATQAARRAGRQRCVRPG